MQYVYVQAAGNESLVCLGNAGKLSKDMQQKLRHLVCVTSQVLSHNATQKYLFHKILLAWLNVASFRLHPGFLSLLVFAGLLFSSFWFE